MKPDLFLAFTCALFSNRKRATSSCPLLAAVCSGVFPPGASLALIKSGLFLMTALSR